jgi:hypothetical protein
MNELRANGNRADVGEAVKVRVRWWWDRRKGWVGGWSSIQR